MSCSSPSPLERPAADRLWPRFEAAARSFGVSAEAASFEPLFRASFERAEGDPAYRANWLQPGAAPLEWSFSERDPDALRVELQPFDCAICGAERLRLAVDALTPLLESRFGADPVREWAAMLEKGGPMPRPRFGAFVGLALRPNALPALKIYVEDEGCGPAGWARLVRGAARLFRSVALGPDGATERHYLLCRDGIGLLDLEPLCGVLGLPHRFPELAARVLDLTDGVFDLPPRSVLLGIRTGAEGAELKLELVAGSAVAMEGLAARAERNLRPEALPAFRRWARLVHPGGIGEMPVAVISLNVAGQGPLGLSLYVAEPAGPE